ncbi:MAG: hypothetical protein AAF587_25635 [Bacteroidota bacterium]
MSDLGSFESVFRRALRTRYEYEDISLQNILVITDLEEEEESSFLTLLKQYLKPKLVGDAFEFTVFGRKQFAPWSHLRARIDQINPDLIISYRMLWVEDITAPKSLGSYIDLLSQDTDFPLLVMPHPRLHDMKEVLDKPGAILVASEHAYANHHQVNYSLNFVEDGAPLVLVHIEDEDTFEYYMDSIEKIPALDTEVARDSLHDQLLAGPLHYAESVEEYIRQNFPNIDIQTHITFGHLITAYQELLHSQLVDLLVTNTKDDTQLAMHSIGYSLAVEFRQTPVLLL